MNDRNDFRPAPGHRASDPSIEEMLRRARDAPLDGARGTTARHAPHLTPLPPPERRAAHGVWLNAYVVLVLGILLGVLGTYTLIQIGRSAGSAPSGEPAAQQAPAAPTTAPLSPTDTPLPTPTDTPPPAPTAVPTNPAAPGVAPPTIREVVALAQNYYDNWYAGNYLMLAVTDVQIEQQSETQLTVCLAYDSATVTAPDTVAGTKVRAFTLAPSNDGTWKVVQMGGPDSCSLS